MLASRAGLEVLLRERSLYLRHPGGDMAERPRRRAAPSAAQTRLKELEARLAQLEDQLKALRAETAGSVGAARVKIRRVGRRAAGNISRAQHTLEPCLRSNNREPGNM